MRENTSSYYTGIIYRYQAAGRKQQIMCIPGTEYHSSKYDIYEYANALPGILQETGSMQQGHKVQQTYLVYPYL